MVHLVLPVRAARRADPRLVQPRIPLPDLGLGTPFTTDFWIVEFPTTTLISAFAAAAIGLSLHQAAYSAEIIRAGILSVDQGQHEAAGALGLPRSIRFFRITLPQAARAIVPNAINEIIGLVKGTSVVFIVALPELFYTVQVIYNRNQRVIPLLLVAVVWYRAHHHGALDRPVLRGATLRPGFGARAAADAHPTGPTLGHGALEPARRHAHRGRPAAVRTTRTRRDGRCAASDQSRTGGAA